MLDALLNFLSCQADYLSFAEGMILAALGIVCLVMGRTHRGGGWNGLALFGGFLAFSRWVGLAEQLPHSPVWFAQIRFVLELLAFISLLYFAYWGERRVRRVFAVGVAVSLLAIVFVGVLQKRFSTTASISFGTLEWVAGGWAGGALFYMAQKSSGPARWRLRAAAIPLVLYGMAVGAPSLMLQSPLEAASLPRDPLLFLVRLLRPLMMAALVWLIAVSARGAPDETRPSRRSLFNLSPMAWGLAVGGVMLILCFELVNMAGDYGDRLHRRGLLLWAQTAAATIPQEWVQQLTKTEGSDPSPVYLQTCAMLRDICRRNLDLRLVYLLAVKNGKIVYLAHSELPGAPGSPQPGQVFENSSDTLWSMFQGGLSFAEGAMETRGNQWLCAFADVHATELSRASAVLGMDTDAHMERQVVIRYRLVGIGLALVLNLLILALFAGLQLNKDWAETAAAVEQRFRAVFENAAESVLVFEADTGRMRMANPFACEWLGYQPEETPALKIEDVVKGSLADIRKQLLSSRKLNEEYVFRRKDGFLLSGEMTGATLRLLDADCIVAFARDITARKRNEAELQRTLADLARFNSLMVGRETRVMELKQEVNAACRALNRPPAYASVESAGDGLPPHNQEAPA